MARELDDPALVSEAISYSAFLSFRRGDNARAEELLEERTASRRACQHCPGCFHSSIWAMSPLLKASLNGRQGATEAIEQVQSAGYEWGLRDMQAGLAAVMFGLAIYRERQRCIERVCGDPMLGLLAACAQFTARSSRHRGRNRTTRDGRAPARGGGESHYLPRRAHFHPRSALTTGSSRRCAQHWERTGSLLCGKPAGRCTSRWRLLKRWTWPPPMQDMWFQIRPDCETSGCGASWQRTA